MKPSATVNLLASSVLLSGFFSASCASTPVPSTAHTVQPTRANASADAGHARHASQRGPRILPPTALPLDAPCDVARDRAAILAMAGTFEVKFTFEETEALTPGYEPEAPYHAEATEVVTPIAVSDQNVVLQHVLLLRKHSGETSAMKHWRQDWTFEDARLVEFQGRRIWQQRSLTPEQAHCTWTQAVFEVDDGPRYESYGRFSHTGEGGNARSEWTSQSTWRPLPRREYTQRHDYDVLLGVNRHVITPDGWTHEQDNVKLVLEGQRNLVRERGFNDYRRVQVKESAIAQRYLEVTNAFWADVRAEWQSVLDSSPRVLVHQELSGKPLYELLFPMADHLQQTAVSHAQNAPVAPAPGDQRAQIHAAVVKYIEANPPATLTALTTVQTP